jgi:hypothetical protein
MKNTEMYFALLGSDTLMSCLVVGSGVCSFCVVHKHQDADWTLKPR